MIEIRPITPDEWMDAKRVVYRVAFVIFGRERPLEEFIAYHESIHELKDMDDIQKSYFENGGTFLGMFQDGEMICTGALAQDRRQDLRAQKTLAVERISRPGPGLPDAAGTAGHRKKHGISARPAGDGSHRPEPGACIL